MNITLRLLLSEDIFFLIVIGLFLYLRQRPYAILAAVLFVIALLVNVMTLRGFFSTFTLGLSLFFTTLIVLIARPFLPRPRIMMGVRTSRVVLIISLFAFLILTVLFISIIVFGRRQ